MEGNRPLFCTDGYGCVRSNRCNATAARAVHATFCVAANAAIRRIRGLNGNQRLSVWLSASSALSELIIVQSLTDHGFKSLKLYRVQVLILCLQADPGVYFQVNQLPYQIQYPSRANHLFLNTYCRDNYAILQEIYPQ